LFIEVNFILSAQVPRVLVSGNANPITVR